MPQRKTHLCRFIALVGACAITVGLQADDFTFKLPRESAFQIDFPASQAAQAGGQQWLTAHATAGDTNRVELGGRLVLELETSQDLAALLKGRPLNVARTLRTNLFILQGPDALSAIQQAQSLAGQAGVRTCYPVMRRTLDQNSPYALRGNDPFAVPYFYTSGGQYVEAQWPLENRDADGRSLGFDLNVFAAWPYTRGEGVTVAVADGGLDFIHPELTDRLAGAPHLNFNNLTTNAGPYGGGQSDPYREFWTHGTSCAGLIAATENNGRGIAGVAPKASLASWVIFTTNRMAVDDEHLMDMYQYASNIVAVQNHSWGSGSGKAVGGPTFLELVGMDNAITLGRNGRGSIMVRAAGNNRGLMARADDDAYVNDPNVLTVAAVSRGGRTTEYSEPGACVMVAAPGGGSGYQGLCTLDLQGDTRGVNSGIPYFSDYADYRTGTTLGFTGTSGAAPFVSGIAALLVSANPNLSYRDVQQIILLSARQVDLADPGLVINGAGLSVSHNAGFGVPDAGHAMWLARMWSNRPPLTQLSLAASGSVAIPDSGLKIAVTGAGVPPNLSAITCLPADAGAHADSPTAALQLVDIGVATNVPALNLTNKGALIQRSGASFATVIANAARAGAAFAVIYDSTNQAGFNLGLLVGTDYLPIPAVFIGNQTGETLKALFQTNAAARARIQLNSANLTFDIESTLLCEQVGVELRIDHPLRGDLRITLVSPQGTRSVLAQLNDDTNGAPSGWIYWSTHHFFESSAGRWTLCVSDQAGGATGVVRSANLIFRGTQITDTDHDGLDDAWEQTRIGWRGLGPKDDPDGDGFSNAREQLMKTDPLHPDLPSRVDIGAWTLFGARLARLSWPSVPGVNYAVSTTTNVNQPMTWLTNVAGRIWETDFYGSSPDLQQNFFQVAPLPSP